MPLFLNSVQLAGYYNIPDGLFGSKTIQPAYKFNALFLTNPFANKKPDLGPMPLIAPYHFLGIDLPSYKFNKETVMYGQVPRSYPVLDMSGSMEVSCLFEEDENGTIGYFVNWCQRNNIDNKGYYRSPGKQNRIGDLIIEIQDKMGLPVMYYVCKNLFYLSADDLKYDYASNDSVKMRVTFATDIIESWFVKGELQNKVQSAIGSAFGI
jgi:hypothetical protein